MFTFTPLFSKLETAAMLLMMSSVRLENRSLSIFGHYNVLVMFLTVQDAVSLCIIVETAKKKRKKEKY